MYCKSCLQVNPLPRCVEQGGLIVINGIIFPDNVNDTLYAILWDHSMNRQIMWTITTDALGLVDSTDGNPTNGIDITDAYNLMGHAYEIEFTNTNLEPVLATVDGQTGCCIKFTTLKPLVGNGEIELSTGTCNA